MEQENNPDELIDLSHALDNVDNNSTVQDEYVEKERIKRIPTIYRLIMKLSFGLIKTEKDAKIIAVLIIIITNLVTFFLLFNGGEKETFQEDLMPAEMMAESI